MNRILAIALPLVILVLFVITGTAMTISAWTDQPKPMPSFEPKPMPACLFRPKTQLSEPHQIVELAGYPYYCEQFADKVLCSAFMECER